MNRRRALIPAFILALSAIVGAASPVAAQSPDLTGENLISVGDWVFDPSNCDTTQEQTFYFELEGEAIGPYPGTFRENGTFTIAPGGIPGNRPVIAFHATFTITSPLGIVTGTKRLAAPEGAGAACATTPTGESVVAVGGLFICYNAQLPDGTTDTGVLSGNQIGGDAGMSQETFLSDNRPGGGPPTPCNQPGGNCDGDDDRRRGDDDDDDDDECDDDDDDDDSDSDSDDKDKDKKKKGEREGKRDRR